MDIQAILDASDSSTEEEDQQQPQFQQLPTTQTETETTRSTTRRPQYAYHHSRQPSESSVPNNSMDQKVYAQSYAKLTEDYHRYAGAAGVDLEQILREADYDDDGGDVDAEDLDDEMDPAFTAAYSKANHTSPTQRMRNNPFGGGASYPETAPSGLPSSGTSVTSSYAPLTSAAGEDWDVLQAILGEDEEEEEEEDDFEDAQGDQDMRRRMATGLGDIGSTRRYDYLRTPNVTVSSSGDVEDWNNLDNPGRSQVDLILQQSEDEEDDLMSDKLGVSSNAFWSSSVSNVIKNPPRFEQDITQTNTDSFVTAAQSDLSHSEQVATLLSHTGSSGNHVPPITAAPSSDWDLEKASQKALQYARAYERKLFKSGHRDIVSPLMVKRRLKPKIELNTKQQQTQRQQTGPDTPHATDHNKNGNNRLFSNIQNAPLRFDFSGVVENKRMARVSATLLKQNASDLPTALCINSRFIAVGTQKGVILVFDLFESLRQKLTNGGDTPFNVKTAGSVTTIDLSLVHGEILAAGYTSGFIVLWDTIKGVALRTVIENQNPSPITNVRFLSKLNLVTVDAGGLVHKLNFSRNILWNSYGVESECLLDGTAGQILAMNVLDPYTAVHQQLPYATPAMKSIVLIALSSERSSFAVAVEPTVHVLHRWAKPTEEQMQAPSSYKPETTANGEDSTQVYLPCLSWGWSLVSGGGNAHTPILARGWGCSIQLLQANFQEEDPNMVQEVFPWPAFGVHDEFQSSAPIVALEWLNDRSLIYLTVSNEFTVVDTVMMTLLERLDFSDLRLVYAEFSLSRKVEMEDSNFCTTFQNSIRSRDNRLLLLCQEEVKSVSIVGAKRRISALESDGEWLEALALALDHYENTVSSQQDRRRDPKGRRDLSKHPEYASLAKSEEEEWIAKLLIRYLTIAVENAPEITEDLPQEMIQSQFELAQSHFQMLAGVCVEFCVVTKRLDLLFGPIFRRFHASGFLSVFLDVLEPYILNDKLDYIAPEAMAHFVEHCRTTNGIATVERCLLHMDVTIMDFDTILGLLKANEMYSALFYVFNQGLNDFTAPLEILTEKILDAADTLNTPIESQERRMDGVPRNLFERYGYKAILYLRYCFEGRSFPQDVKIEDLDRVALTRSQLLAFLLQETYEPTAVRKPSSVIGQRALRYPYTHVLLMVDPKAMLETLSMAMSSTDGLARSWDVAEGSSGMPGCQEVISMLLSIIMPDEDDFVTRKQSTLHQSQPTINAFLDFLAEYLMKGVVQANKVVTFMILQRMATRFETAKTPEDRLDSQKQILQLLTALPRNSYDPPKVLLLVQKSSIHRAALLLHQEGATAWGSTETVDDIENRASHFRAAIDCYLEDDDLDFRKEVFAYVKKECLGASQEHMEAEKKPNALREALAAKLVQLVQLDALLTAELVAELFVEDLDAVIHHLHDETARYLFFEAIVSGVLDGKDQVSGALLKANMTTDHHHQYLALMAKLYPEKVYDYLQSRDNYRPEACLPLCQKFEIADASCYLLERMGSVSSALQLILQTLESRMMSLKRTIRGVGTEVFSKYTSPRHAGMPFRRRDFPRDTFDITENEINEVKRILVVALDLCQRNSGTYSSRTEHGSQLWFNVLDRLISAKGFLRLSKEQPVHAKVMAGVLSELLRLTMQRMVSSVPLPDLVRKVTSDHSGSRLGELREMVESLLSTYGFEVSVFSGAIDVFHHDSAQMQKKHKALRVHGSHVRSVVSTPLDEAKENIEAKVRLESIPDGTILEVGGARNATIADTTVNDNLKSSATGGQGLGNALNKLRSRRAGRSVPTTASASRTARGVGLNLMTCHEREYSQGVLSPDVTYFEDRIEGVLGDAEHRGRLMSFTY